MMSDLGTSVTIAISAPIDAVWRAITSPDLIQEWFFGVRTESDWEPGSSLVHTGEWQGKPYTDVGTILEFEPPTRLVHTHWSELSGSPNDPDHHQVVTWALADVDGSTELTIAERNLPSEEAKEVSDQAWRTALANLKGMLEA